MVNLISLMEGSGRSLSLGLGSTEFPLTDGEFKLLRDLLDLYQQTIGGYDAGGSISVEFEQSGNEHSKRSFMAWAKARYEMLLSQQEKELGGEIWS